MKKLVIAFLPWLFTAFGYKAMAQDEKKSTKEESQEIIIRKKGDKTTKLTLEINGDAVLINGKPMVEFNEDGITVNKKKIIIKEGQKLRFADRNGGEGGSRSFMWNDDENESRAFLGVTTDKDEKGAIIREITASSAAEKAGLQKDDIITKIGDQAITGPDVLSNAITAKKPKDEVKIYYLRNGKEKNTKATLGERKSSVKTYSFSGPDGSFNTFTVPGVPFAPDMGNFEQLRELESLRNLAPDMAEGFNRFDFDFDGPFSKRQKLGIKIQDTEESTGVKVLEVSDSSAAANAGLKKDDIITEIDGKKVMNTDDAREQLADAAEKSTYNIKARRNGTEMSFDIKIPKKLKTANL